MARRDAFPLAPGIAVPARTARPRSITAAPVRAQLALLRFALPRTTPGIVAVFNEQGALVRTVLSGELAAGEHACAWDGRDDADVPVPPGSYTVRLEVAGSALTSRRVVIG